MGDWQIGTFSCFSNCTLCCATMFIPCIVIGKTAEAVDKSFCLCCIASMIPLVNIITFVQTRGAVRDKNGIDGSFINDCLCTLLCSCCTVIQTANEVGVFS